MGPDGFALVALGVYKNGQIVYKRGYGMADLTRSRARIMICRVGEYPTATVAVICFQIPGNLCSGPPYLKLWSRHRRLGQQSFVQLRRPSIAPQLTHLDGTRIPLPTMQDHQIYIWSMLLTSEGINQTRGLFADSNSTRHHHPRLAGQRVQGRFPVPIQGWPHRHPAELDIGVFLG